MPHRTGTRARILRGLAVLVVLVSGGCGGEAPRQDSSAPPAARPPEGNASKQGPDAAPTELPPEVVAAWQKAGARVGCVRVEVFGDLRFLPEKAGKAGEVPAFQFSPWKGGVLAKLPAPAVPFGLDLFDTQLTDAGLKELAGLKTLHTLDLGVTKVTDAGLKELAGLKSLHALDLGTDEGTDAE